MLSVRPSLLFQIKKNKTDLHCRSFVGWPSLLTTLVLLNLSKSYFTDYMRHMSQFQDLDSHERCVIHGFCFAPCKFPLCFAPVRMLPRKIGWAGKSRRTWRFVRCSCARWRQRWRLAMGRISWQETWGTVSIIHD